MSKKKKLTAIISSVVILALTAGYFSITKLNNKEDEEDINRQREYEVTRGDITSGTNGSGSIKFEPVNHNFSENVIIDEVFVKEGQRVKKGDKLASLSTDEMQNQLDELNNSLKKANIELNSAKNSPEYSKDAVELAQMEVSKIKKDIEKIKKLKNSPILYAKANGVVMSIGYIEGSETVAETPVVVIGDSDKVYSEISVSQHDIINIEENQIVNLEVAAFPDEKIKGKVTYVNLKAPEDASSPMYKVIVEIESKDYELLEGMTTTAQFILKEVKDTLMLSNKAIKLKDGKQVVQVKNEDGTLKELQIQTGFSDGKNSEILRGLKEGDTVVVGG